MARTKKPATTHQDEHMALDAAMSELARQTDALLQQTIKEEPKKPTLPKKQKKVVPHTKGAHLDIVGHTPSSLKKGKKKSEHTEGLLPATAGLSYNETPADIPDSRASKSKPAASSTDLLTAAPVAESISGHKLKRLPVVPDDTPAPDASVDPVPNQHTEHIKVDDVDVPETIEVTHPKASQAKKEPTKHLPKESSEQSEPDTVDKKATPTTAKTLLPDDDEIDNTEEKEAAADSGADDGIVKIEKTEQKDAAYDIAEYQAELHDWSKLSSNSHWSVALLLLLMVAAGALMYLYFSNQLPVIF